MARFRGIIITQWVLLSGKKTADWDIFFTYYSLVNLILGLVFTFLSLRSLLITAFYSGDSSFGAVFAFGFASVSLVVPAIGMIASGFGTSIYTTANRDGIDMAMKKAIFSVFVSRL